MVDGRTDEQEKLSKGLPLGSMNGRAALRCRALLHLQSPTMYVSIKGTDLLVVSVKC